MRYAGGIRRENADMSNIKTSEMLVDRKSKVFYAMLIIVELVGPKANRKDKSMDNRLIFLYLLYGVMERLRELSFVY